MSAFPESVSSVRSDENRSERNVRNGSESAKPSVKQGGRRPLLDDTALLKLAHDLHARVGRVPRIDELIEQSGGCQRKRAVDALQQLRQSLAQKRVLSSLVFPAPHENEIRALMGRWMVLASEQLAQQQAFQDAQAEQEQFRAQHLVEELELRVLEQDRSLDELETAAASHHERIGAMTRLCEVLRSERDSARAIAEERGRLLESLLTRTTAV